jgi:hypothetical protein
LPGRLDPRANGGITAHRLHIGGNPVAQRQRHIAPAEQPQQTLHFHLRKTGLGNGRHVRQGRLALGTHHGEYSCLARGNRTLHREQGVRNNLHAALAEIGLLAHGGPVRNVNRLEPIALQHRREHKVR